MPVEPALPPVPPVLVPMAQSWGHRSGSSRSQMWLPQLVIVDRQSVRQLMMVSEPEQYPSPQYEQSDGQDKAYSPGPQ